MKRHPLLNLFVLTTLAGRAAVAPLEFESNAFLRANVFNSETVLASSFTDLQETHRASVGGSDLDQSVQDLVKISGHVAGRGFVVRDEGDFLRYLGSASIDLAQAPVSATPGAETSLTLDADTIFSFEITGNPKTVELSLLHRGLLAASVILEDEDGIILFEEAGNDSLGGFTSTLAPGRYTLTTRIPVITTTTPSVYVGKLVELAVGTEPDEVPLPSPGNFTHPGIATPLSGEGRLAIVNPQVLSETDLGNGFTEMRVTTEVNNPGNTPWLGVVASILPELAEAPPVEVLSDLPAFDLPLSTSAGPPPGSEAVLRVANADLAAVRDSILDGSRFQLSGREQLVFAYPVHPVGRGTYEERPPSSPDARPRTLELFDAPLFRAGAILLEWEPLYRVPLVTIIEPGNPPLLTRAQGFDRDLPALIKDITLELSGFQLELHEVEGAFRRFRIHELLREGVWQSPVEPEEHPHDFGITEIPETKQSNNGLAITGFFPMPVPLHFNQIELSPGIHASGSFGFRPEEIRVDLEMRGSTLKELMVRARFRADCNLLLETQEGADNSAEPIAGREATLLDLPLFQVNLPAGLQFAPRLELTAGAVVSAPTSLSLPLTAGLDIEVAAGVRDGAPHYEQDFTPIPLQVSDPGLYEALGATATAYLDCEIKALLGFSDGLLNAGPTLGARAQADFTLQPLDNPWWTTEAALSVFGGVELDLAGLVTLVDAEQTLRSWPLSDFFPAEADGPLGDIGPKSNPPDPSPGFQALGNPKTRWHRSLLTSNGISAGSRSFAVALEGSEDLVAGAGSLTPGVIARYSPEGELLWAIDPTIQMNATKGVPEPDGGFTVLSGGRTALRLAKLSGTGEPVWHQEFRGSGGALWSRSRAFERFEDASGEAEYVVLGEALDTTAGEFKMALVRVNGAGTVIWSRFYGVTPLDDEGTVATPVALASTNDGKLLVAGFTSANVANPTTIATNISNNGLVFKVDPENGEVIWSTLVASSASLSYSAISESPAGETYVGGNFQHNVLSDMPSMVLTKLDPTGAVIDSVLIGSAASNGPLPHGGESVYDDVRDMVWVDGHLWICGQIGLFNAGSVGGVAEGASGYTAMVSEKLEVSRYCIHAGPATDSLDSLTTTPHGLFVTGTSRSFHEWPYGAADEFDIQPYAMNAMMLPWEGRIPFHQISAGGLVDNDANNPTAGSYFVTPRVRAFSQYTIGTNQSLFGGLGQINLTESGSSRDRVTAEDFSMTNNSFPFAPVPIEPVEFKALEFQPESLVTDLPSYLRWYQLDGNSDSDGDRLSANAEFFLGTDILAPDPCPITFEHYLEDITTHPMVRFTMPRTKRAATAVPGILSAEDLADFSLRTDGSVKVDPVDADRDLLTIELPAPERRQFYQVQFPE